LPVEGKTVRITLSTGIAEYPRNARDKQGLIEAADGALYIAKEGGRNLSILSNADPYIKEIEEEKEALAEEIPPEEIDAGM